MSSIFIFDLGSSKIVGLEASSDFNVISHTLNKSEGINSSLITSLPQAQESIIKAIIALEKISRKSIKEAYVSLSANAIKSFYFQSKIRISNRHVTKQDIQKILHKAFSNSQLEGQQIIHYFPIEFTLDGSSGITDPVGMLGKELGCNLHIVTVDSTKLTNLLNCLSKCNIAVKEIILGIYAAGLASLSQDEEKIGMLVIDFACRVTSFGVFFKGNLLYAGNVPIGSFHITSDISKAFGVSLASAEKIKILHGSCKILKTPGVINLEDIDANEFTSNQVISFSDLSEIINPRVEEIFELLKQKYDEFKIDNLVTKNMTITGGGGLIQNLPEVVGAIFNKSVRICNKHKEIKLSNDHSAYTTSVGMLKHISKKQKEKFKLDLEQGGFLKKAWRWLKENV